MQAGLSPLCRECIHFSMAAADRGHPSPCRQFGWRGTKHVSPDLSADGSTCSDFGPLPIGAETPISTSLAAAPVPPTSDPADLAAGLA